MSLRVTVSGEVNPRGVAGAKASLNRAKVSVIDPNPGDLTMARMKLG